MGRATKAQVEKMRKQFKKKKGTIVYDNFCVAFLRLISDDLFKACTVENKPEESCEDCYYNRRKKRVISDKV